jgi:hypothetical protein
MKVFCSGEQARASNAVSLQVFCSGPPDGATQLSRFSKIEAETARFSQWAGVG